ncbi:MAG TPA: FkbM family methyltransferase [Thermoanaerobaculia bacterium]
MSRPDQPATAETRRPIGQLHTFLEDVKSRGFSPRGIIDVGAHKGNWTRGALGVFPDTPVIMIEPLEEMIPYLEATVRDHPSSRYIAAGAGSTVGTSILTLWEDLRGCSYLMPPGSEEVQRETRLTTINEILASDLQFVPDLVKLDTQGFELEALKGASSLFGRTQLFILETSLFEFMPGMPSSRTVINFMAERGYEIYDVTSFDRRPLDGALAQIDFAFAAAEGWLRSTHRWD